VYYNDLLILEVPKDISWCNIDRVDNFINIYDWDRLIVNDNADNALQYRLVLCAGPLPCAITLLGAGMEKSSLQRMGNSSIVCLESLGCSGLNISKVKLHCSESSSQAPALSAPLDIEGAVLRLENSSVQGCFSQTDGGSVRAYGGAYVQVIVTDLKKPCV
jgi:hypothetical protein